MKKELTRTQYKLAEAEFFLKHLEEHWRHVPHVDFYLSACISAARSVTWVMKSEFGKAPGWQQWYDGKKPTKEVRDLLKQMNGVRVRLTKTHPVKTSTLANMHIRSEDLTPEVKNYLNSGHSEALQIEPIDQSNTVFNIKVDGRIITKSYLKKADHQMPEFQGRNAKDVCKEYINELKGLVYECLEKFNR